MTDLLRNVELVNLTPHDIDVFSINVPPQLLMRIAKTDSIARVEMTEKELGVIQGCPVFAKVLSGTISGLPDPQDGILYVVSTMVLDAVKERSDLLSPDTGPSCIRDSSNRIKGITRFMMRE